MKWGSAIGLCVSCASLLAGATASGELIYNGDFGFGTTGFASSYTLVPSNVTEEQYGIVANPNAVGNPFPWNASFADFGDNSGSGLMFVSNGSKQALLDPVIWAQAITVEKDVIYDFSFWGAAASAASTASGTAPLLTMSINGTLAMATLDLEGTTVGTYSKASGQFTATDDGEVFVRIRNGTFTATGNDFALDDISVTVVPEPSSLALLGIGSLVGLGVFYTRRRRRLG